MATGYIYNGFEDITLKYAGVEFFFPFNKVTPIPDTSFREVNQRETSENDNGALVFTTFIVKGTRICEELVSRPGSRASEMGIVIIEGVPTGEDVIVHAGLEEEAVGPNPNNPGIPHTAILCPIDESMCCKTHVEVKERKFTHIEQQSALRTAKQYKETVVKEYLQSKRERMSGGNGRLIPDPTTRRYMDELKVQDIDDVSANMNNTEEASIQRLSEIFAKSMAAATEQNRPRRHGKRAPKLLEEERLAKAAKEEQESKVEEFVTEG
jgi:hypothetical protein